MNNIRRPSGIPEGGQFAGKTRGDAAVSLDDEIDPKEVIRANKKKIRALERRLTNARQKARDLSREIQAAEEEIRAAEVADKYQSKADIIRDLDEIRDKAKYAIHRARSFKLSSGDNQKLISTLIDETDSVTSNLERLVSDAHHSKRFNQDELSEYFDDVDSLLLLRIDLNAALSRARSTIPRVVAEAETILNHGYGEGYSYSCSNCGGAQNGYDDQDYYCVSCH